MHRSTSPCTQDILPGRDVFRVTCDLFKFREIRDSILETVQGRDMVAMED